MDSFSSNQLKSENITNNEKDSEYSLSTEINEVKEEIFELKEELLKLKRDLLKTNETWTRKTSKEVFTKNTGKNTINDTFFKLKNFAYMKTPKKNNKLFRGYIKRSLSEEKNNEKVTEFDKLINNFYILSCDKEKINNFISEDKIDYQICYQSKIEKKNSTTDFINYIIPLENKMKIKYSENKINNINNLLFKEKRYDYYFIKLNNNLIENEMLKKIHFNKILHKMNPLIQDYFYVFEMKDFFLNDYNNNFNKDKNYNPFKNDQDHILENLHKDVNKNLKRINSMSSVTYKPTQINKLEFFNTPQKQKKKHQYDYMMEKISENEEYNFGKNEDWDKKKDLKFNFIKRNSFKTPLENHKKLEIVFFNKYYVIKSYYPVSNIFLNIFLEYFEMIKNKKMELFEKAISGDKVNFNKLQQLDSDFFLKFEKIKLNKIFERLYNFSINSLQINMNIKNLILNEKSKKTTEYLLDAKRSESEIALKKILEKVPFLDFLFLYISLTLEKSLIIVSESKYKVSFLISILLSFLKPFLWVFPIIFNLPINCLDMLGSPVPLIVGINCTPNYMFNTIIPNYIKNDNFVIYFPDQNLLHFNYQAIKEFIIPNYNSFFFDFEALYFSKFTIQNSFNLKVEINKQDVAFKINKIKIIRDKISKMKLKDKNNSFNKKKDSNEITNTFLFNKEISFDKISLNFIHDFYIEGIFVHLKKIEFVDKKQIFHIANLLSKIYKNTNDQKFFENFQKSQFFVHYMENKFPI